MLDWLFVGITRTGAPFAVAKFALKVFGIFQPVLGSSLRTDETVCFLVRPDTDSGVLAIRCGRVVVGG